MKSAKRLFLIAGITVVLAGCSFSDEVLWPTATGEDPPTQTSSGGREIPIPPSEGETEAASDTDVATTVATPAATPPTTTIESGSTNGAIVTAPLPGGGATGTLVGARVAELSRELDRLNQSIQSNGSQLQGLRAQSAKNAQTYNASVSDVRSRLQVGTTPGNPEVIALWNSAQQQLDAVNADIGPMTNLANNINNNATVAGFLLESIRSSYNLAGGVDADHRNLEKLESGSAEALQQADQIRAAINGEISQQAAYVSSERQNMTTLALAIDKGHFLNAPVAARSRASPPPAPTAAAPSAGSSGQVASVSGRRPLVIIRFDRPDVNYEDPLFSAANQALQRFPNAQFDLVAVAPANGTPETQASTRRNAERVMRSLTGMGIPANRMTMAATTSPTVVNEEVHIYVR